MIGGDLEYLMSSLPYLSFHNSENRKREVISIFQKYAGLAEGELSLAEILNIEVEKFLPESTFRIFQEVTLNNIHEKKFQNSNNKVLSAFSKFNFELKEKLKAWRTLPNESDKKSPKNNIGKITGDGTPLEKEVQLMKYQWDNLDEFSANHFADPEAIFCYKFKLLILLRWWSFDVDKGFKIFTQLTLND